MNANASSFMPRQIRDHELVFPDQEVIRLKAKELKLDWIPSVEYVTELSDDSLRKLFGKLYKGHRRKFAEHYGIPIKLFDSYMHLSFHAPSRACIQRWLLHSTGLSELIEEEHLVDVSHQIRNTVYELRDSINMVRDKISYVCFVDGDNYPHALAELSGLDGANGVYVVYYCLTDTFCYQMNLWKDSSFFSIRYTLQRGKDASDVLICMDTSFLHLLLPPDLPFVIISGDDFTAELTVNLQQLGRPIQRVVPRIRNLRLYFHLLSEPELWSDMTQNPITLAHTIRIAALSSAGLSTSFALPSLPSDLPSDNLSKERNPSKHIFWIGNQDFRWDVIHSRVVDIVIELVHIGLPIPTCDEEGKELDLRIQWKMNWTAPINQFYRKYNLTPRKFSRYLRGIDSPKVEGYIRDFLSHIAH